MFDYFEKHILLSHISKEMILKTVEIVKFKKNTIVINEGEKNENMYIIKVGLVKGYYFNNGEYQITTIWKENDAFGDVLTYISGSPATKSYITIEDVEAYKIDIKKFRALFDINHEICNLGRLLVEQYIVRTELFRKAIINTTAKEKYDFLLDQYPEIYKRCKLKDIASLLGICPETISRVRRKNTG